MNICSKCQCEHERNGRYCFGCHAAYMREWRKTHEMNEGQRRRDNARSIANVMVQRGKMTKQPCIVCGDKKSEMHHPDHELPRLVVWLCRRCHLNWHAHWREVAKQTFDEWIEAAKRKMAA